MSKRILVVDDEPDIRALVAYHLMRDGYEVFIAADGAQALETARKEHPDVIVLDLLLPGMSGYDVLRALRGEEATRDTGVIVLTARSEQPERIKGLTLGADDYLTKPFSPAELGLRIAGLLRRMTAPAISSGSVLVFEQMTIDRNEHRVMVRNDEVSLTPGEFQILLALAERPGRVLSRDYLQETALELQPGIRTRAVVMHVQRLRAKLGEGIGSMIETVRNMGYRLNVGHSGKQRR